MNIKPILFRTDMVRAILDGQKTVTRRAVKPRYQDGECGFRIVTCKIDGAFVRVEITDENEFVTREVQSPYQLGDILYVRETWAKHSCFSDTIPDLACDACEPWMGKNNPYVEYIDRNEHGVDYGCYVYRADSEYDGKVKWRPSIHMPNEAARIFLRVTDVRVERLQEIDNAGALAEGCDGRCLCPSVVPGRSLSCITRDFSVEKFQTAWDSTIKPSDRDKYGWAANPWVWVIEFERCEKPNECSH